MAIKYLSDLQTYKINMQQNALENAVIHPVSTYPASPAEGQVVYHTVNKALEIWNGSIWVSASGDITAVNAGTGLTGGGNAGNVTLSLNYAGVSNFIKSATNSAGTPINTDDFLVYSDGATGNVQYGYVSDLPFTNNLGTVTSVAVSGSNGITVSGSPITSSGTIALGLSNIPNSALANSTITINGTVVSLGGTISVGDITGVSAGNGLTGGGTSGDLTLSVDYSSASNIIAAAPDSTQSIAGTNTILVKRTDGLVYEQTVSLLPFTANLGTVTSISVTGADGINVSGSPITSSGTIALSIANGGIANIKLANSSITIGSTSISLGATSTTLAGLTDLDFAAGNRTIGASIGANNLTLGGSTSTVVIPGNLTVNGTTTTINTTELLVEDNIITLNSGVTGTPSLNGGMEIERGTSPNVSVIWNEASDRWTFTNDGTTFYNIPISTEYNFYSHPTQTAISVDGGGLQFVADVSVNTLGHVTAVTLATIQSASTAQQGVVRLATNAETATGTAADLAVTPAGLASLGLVRSSTHTFVGSATLATNTITHNLNSLNVMVELVDSVTKETVYADVVRATVNTVTVSFNAAPANAITVLISKIG